MQKPHEEYPFKNGAFTPESTVTGLTLSGQSFNGWWTNLYFEGFSYLSCVKLSTVKTGSTGTVMYHEILLADYKTVYILSVTTTGSASIVDSKAFPEPVSCVASGDVNGDGKDEFVVGLAACASYSDFSAQTTGAQYALYIFNFSSPINNPPLATLDSNGALVEAAFGDFEGNNLEQLALCDLNPSTGVQIHMVLKLLGARVRSGPAFLIPGHGRTPVICRPTVTMATCRSGGSSEYGQFIINGNATDYFPWINSIRDNPVFCDFDNATPIIPVWDLCDRTSWSRSA